MGETADAVIIGAGLNGAATAYFLLRLGMRRILLLEAELPGAGASGDDVGLLRSHYDNRPEMELAAKSLPYFRNWSEMIGGDCDWSQTGFFRFVEPDQLEQMRLNVAMQQEFGERVDILSPDRVRDIAPEFRADDIGAVLHEPESGTASNALATAALLKRACAEGAMLRVFTKASRIRTENGRVVGVEAGDEAFSAPIVVLAAGATSRDIAATCAVDLPLTAKEIRVAEVLPPPGLRVPGSYMDPISDSWIAPRAQGRALVSAPNDAPGAPNGRNGGQAFSRAVAASGLAPVSRRLPGMEAATVVRWWSRPDCYAPDGKPIIGGADEVPGLYVNTAGAGKGHKVAPAAGLALAELIVDGVARSADIAPFALARFKSAGRPWSNSEYRKRVIG